jgi:hypothetical protein
LYAWGITAQIAGSFGMLRSDNKGTINVGVVSKADDPRPDVRVRKSRVVPIAERALNLVEVADYRSCSGDLPWCEGRMV